MLTNLRQKQTKKSNILNILKALKFYREITLKKTDKYK